MRLVVGSYILDNVTSTAYEEFVTYYSSTPASYITNADIERWNTRDDISQFVTYSYLSENISDKVSYSYLNEALSDKVSYSYLNEALSNVSVDLSSYATKEYVDEAIYEVDIPDTSNFTTYSYLSEVVSDKVSYSYLNEALSNVSVDLSSYATINYVDTSIANITVPEEIISSYSYGYVLSKYKDNYTYIGEDTIILGGGNIYGKNQKATSSLIGGYINNSIMGTYNFAWGRSNSISITEGFNYPTYIALFGTNNYAANDIYGIAAHHGLGVGNYITLSNPYESGFGTYNLSRRNSNYPQKNIKELYGNNCWPQKDNILFSIGNGKDYNNKHNAFEVRQTGDIFIPYNTNPNYTYNHAYYFNMLCLQDFISYTYENISSGDSVDLSSYATTQMLYSYATKEYVNEAIYEIDIPDTSNFITYSYLSEVVSDKVTYSYLSEEISDKVSYSYINERLDNLDLNIDTTGLVNENRMQEYVLGAITAHTSTEQANYQSYTTNAINNLNISSYATKDYVTDRIVEITSDGAITLDGYATENWVNNQGFLKQDNLSNYVTSSILAANLNNYQLKSSMTSYATKDWVNDAILQAATGEVDLSNYALKSEIPSLDNYYTKNYLNEYFATKDYVTDTVIDITSGGTITLDGYATENWVNNNFVTNNTLNNYYTKSQVDSKIPDLSSYITFDWIEGYYNQYVKDYCNTFNTSDANLAYYVTKTELNQASYITSNEVNDFVSYTYLSEKISDKVSYTYLNEALSNVSVDLSSYATKEYVDEAIYEIDIPESVDTTNFITKSELESFSYNIIPSDGYAYGFGSSSNVWDYLYVSSIDTGSSGRLNLRTNGNNRLILFSNRLYPYPNNYVSLGVESNAWKDTYTYNLYTYTENGFIDLYSYITTNIGNIETLLSQI